MCGREIPPNQVIAEFTFDYYVHSIPEKDPRSSYAYTFKTYETRVLENPNEDKELTRHGHEGKKGIPFVKKRYTKGGVVKFTNHRCVGANCGLFESRKGKVYLVSLGARIQCGHELTFKYDTPPKGPCWCKACESR